MDHGNGKEGRMRETEEGRFDFVCYHVTPKSKPRQTQSDKWKKRPAVVAYRAYRDALRGMDLWLPTQGAFVLFLVPVPKSWSEIKRQAYHLIGHQATPDIDNFLKGLMDAADIGRAGVGEDDRAVWDVHVQARWVNMARGAVVVEQRVARVPPYLNQVLQHLRGGD
jgi:Holliday junction resolvase RusA-like endonuclease